MTVYVHNEGSFDTLKEARAEAARWKAKGYASKVFTIRYGKTTRPLYRVFRTMDKATTYPTTRRR